MNEERVIALAGIFQSAALVRTIAVTGNNDTAAFESSIASILRIDADSPAQVFGGIAGVRLGLEALTQQVDDPQRAAAVTQIAAAIMRVERKLARRRDLLDRLREGISGVQRQVDHLGIGHSAVSSRLAELYATTLSTLRPRVVVQGNPLFLQQSHLVERIRATLLAGVRAAVLWRQLGGNQWQLFLQQRQCLMLARGLLARCRLDGG
ncbi:high frequency lysogenization protein HflD [Tahibacter amnicola]|uniref:High frequency lysogenization protein HflD homolog n=1 Tax=Tahibacter amnicola TaxID=2976241 RepID=A0ABY6BJR7_9GAMM|nr:high frequency lysogenization protein HflD [Tahibacter amnicola]UXI70014.1 high frequency lysogenization protein HflD [Tahibacter amnicola]